MPVPAPGPYFIFPGGRGRGSHIATRRFEQRPPIANSGVHLVTFSSGPRGILRRLLGTKDAIRRGSVMDVVGFWEVSYIEKWCWVLGPSGDQPATHPDLGRRSMDVAATHVAAI